MLNRPVVAVCDNDDAGIKLSTFGDYVEVVPEGKDLGDATEDYVQYLLNKYATWQTGTLTLSVGVFLCYTTMVVKC